ncbi:hypothetical protein LCGC14_0533600 [marine sediment metagenome]|uniref:Uncharacterized protein n=1 Tax=marine sediment metagenome TaxID=412755 RepID=A0A0F9RV43_9ZZZZ
MMMKIGMILDQHPDARNLGLKALGYWKSGSEPNLPDPKDFIGTWDNEKIKRLVINYVKNAQATLHWKGWSECRFKCSSSDIGSSCLSDGTYVWPEGFYHYLEAHNVIPPIEFIMHALVETNKLQKQS